MFIFLYAETTGIESDDTICGLAYKTETGLTVNEYFAPHKDINCISIGNATNEMVEHKSVFRGSEYAHQLNKLLQDPRNIMVAHNANRVVIMLKKEGVESGRVICTLKLARFMDRLGKFPEDNLQYLRYRLGIEQEETTVRDPLGNMLIVERIFYRLYHRFFVDHFPDGEEKQSITKEAIKSSMNSSEYPQPRFNPVFFNMAWTKEHEESAITKMVDISKDNLIITSNTFWKKSSIPQTEAN
ncbi:MAG: hypothetical protein HQK65_00395 [Desulfamplus sp.]|nr:hypothetical protein [Desulfamplus sp.]